MEFGGNQGVIGDSVKIHEQEICSRVQNCGDLDGENSICGWCYMGRKGDGKGEGMVALVDKDGNKMGETKYMDDYCPWPGEVDKSGKPTKQWTGPTEGSAWLKEQANQDYSAADIQKIDLQLQQDKINQLNAKKNNDALTPKERTAAGKMIKYVTDKMKFIMNFGEQSKEESGETNNNTAYKQWKNKAMPSQGIGIGSDENNKFLYKCGNGTATIEGSGKNIFFLHSYNGLSEEQKVILKGLHETHEFFKKCHTNMSILGKKITLTDNEELITKCHQLSNILNKTGNEELKKLFFTLDLSKDESGCLENCEFTKGKYEFIPTKLFKNWWTNDNQQTDNQQTDKCQALTLSEILTLTGSNKTKADLEAEIEEAPTVENSTCCNDGWDPTTNQFKKCSDQQKKSNLNCKGGCKENVNEAVCKLYAQDLGLDVNDINQYDPNGYVSKGYPYGCSTNYEGTHVVYVPETIGGDGKGGEDTYGNGVRAGLKTQNKVKADAKDKAYRDAATKIKNAEDEEKKIPSKDRNIENYNRHIRYWQNQINRKQSIINYHKKHGKNWKLGTRETPYRQRYWKKCAYRIIWCIGAYRYRWTTKRTNYWYVSGLTSSAANAITKAEGNKSRYSVNKAHWVSRKATAEGERKYFRTNANNLRNEAQRMKTNADTNLARAKGPSYPFSNPDQQGEGRTIRYSVCSLSNNEGIDYPTQTAKMFRHDPDTGLKENINDWAKIINKENKITSFEELLKVWLKSKINVNRGGDDSDGGEYSETVKNVWDIFIEMAKTKNPGLFVKEAALAKKQVLGNSPLNDQEKIDKLKPYEIGNLGAESIEGLPDATGNRQSQPGWRYTVIKDIDTGIVIKDKGQRLMTTNGECTALDAKFPCFKNWQGNKKDENGDPMGHSDECYNELWHTQTMKNFETGQYEDESCYTKTNQVGFKRQMSKTFNNRNKKGNDSLIPYTITVMNKQPIPSVKMDIEKIRKVADTSNQYEPIYSLNIEEDIQINSSAKVAALACYGEEPTFDDGNKDARGGANSDVPFACKDRFRRKDKNFPRPKKCLDYYWKKNTTNIPAFANESYTYSDPPKKTDKGFQDTTSWNRGKKFHILDTGYNPYPPNNDTYGKVWGNANEPKDKFEDKIHYDDDNTTLNNDLSTMVKYISGFSGENAQPRNASDYDKYLYFKRLVFETINEHEDAIWQYLKKEETVKIGYSIGEDSKPWVKMCWGDFKDALLLEYRDTKHKIKEEGDGTLNLKDAPELKNIIEYDSRAKSVQSTNMSLNRKVIKTDDNFKFNPGFGKMNVGGRMKFEIDNPTSITEKLYNKTWFPFWRFFMFLPSEGVKYYRRVEFNQNEKTQHDKTKTRNANFGKLNSTELWRRGFRLKDKGGTGCTPNKPCAVCEGDCDKDADCKPGLKCFQRSSSKNQVPGCAKGGTGDVPTHDYCYKPLV